jgi:hypothetical protein
MLDRILVSLKRTIAVCLLLWLAVAGGCTTIRITDPDHTADELYLENVASKLAVDQVSASVLRDRRVYIDSTYLTAATQPSDQQQFLIGELRAKLLLTGVRLTPQRKDAEIILELRSQGTSVNHMEFLLGVPASTVGKHFHRGGLRHRHQNCRSSKIHNSMDIPAWHTSPIGRIPVKWWRHQGHLWDAPIEMITGSLEWGRRRSAMSHLRSRHRSRAEPHPIDRPAEPPPRLSLLRRFIKLHRLAAVKP